MLMYPLIVCELNGEFIKKEKFAKRKIKEKLPKRFFFEKLSYIYTKKKRKKDDFYLTFSMELSPSHDFNSDKCEIYIGGVHFKVPQQ